MTIDYDASSTLADVVDAINSKASGVQASTVFDGTAYHLFLRAADTGVANAISYTESGDGLGITRTVTAADAKITLGDVPVSRSSNHLDDVVAGLTLDLLATTPDGDAGATVTIASDVSGAKGKLKSLVAAYNNIASALSSQLSYNGTQKGQDTLFADPTLQGLSRALGTAVSSSYGGQSLGLLGVTLASDGTMAVDDTKLAAALAKNPRALESLLAGTDGLGATFVSLVKRYTASDGVLAAKQTELKNEITGYDTQIQKVEDTASSLETRLRQQFSNLEQMMSAMSSQSSYITKIFSSTTSTSGS